MEAPPSEVESDRRKTFTGEKLDILAGPFSALGQHLVFGGMVMAEHTGADDGSLQRSIFGHAATEEQSLGVPNRNEAPIRNCGTSARQQTNVAACYHITC